MNRVQACVAAVDLGAESGRVGLVLYDGKRLRFHEIHRFLTGGVRLPRGKASDQAQEGLYWDVPRFWEEIISGIQRTASHSEVKEGIASIGVDTWGVDFALINKHGDLVGLPRHYRDPRAHAYMERVTQQVGRDFIYRRTGIQFMPINTLYQLVALSQEHPSLLSIAHRLLMIPDLFHYWLCGAQVCEFTNATTTQCYNPQRSSWDEELLNAVGVPVSLFPEVVLPGTRLGWLRSSLASAHPKLAQTEVIAPATHDTGSAVAAVPAVPGSSFAYISSGTWSLMGVELRRPLITTETLMENFTNEGGVAGTFRLLKNIAGLWLLQECRRAWAAQGRSFSYEELAQLAQDAPSRRWAINPDDSAFLVPGEMPRKIQAFCERTGQRPPQTPGEVVRCVLESLALRYRWVLERLEKLIDRSIEVIHIVGGGARNALLNQLTADVTGRLVMAGPYEATLIGNALVQLMALGSIPDLSEGRRLIRSSFPIETYEPRVQEQEAWGDHYRWWCEHVLGQR